MRILLTGGTGHLGRPFAGAATAAGHELRVVGRGTPPPGSAYEWARVDLTVDTGLEPALAGTDVVVHAASDPRNAASVDVEGTRRLADAAGRAGVRHFVFVSIVGVDRIPFPYYRHKLAAERIVRDAPVPHSILRAAQFHWFVDELLRQAARFPFLLAVPAGFRVQSIAASEVAEELLRVVEGVPGGLLPNLVGPEPMTLEEAATTWRDVRGLRRPVVSVPLPGSVAAAFRAGHNTDPAHPRGHRTWRQWLEHRYGR